MSEPVEKRKFEVVINRCYGGFSLSDEAHREIARRKGWKLREERSPGGSWLNLWIDEPWAKTYDTVLDHVQRNDPDLIAVVREMGDAANGECAKLKIVEVTSEIEINDNDGMEWVSVYGGNFDY